MADTFSSVVKTWTTGTAYAVRDVVVNSGSYYRCTTAHTAGGTFAGDSANWASLGFTPAGTIYSSLQAWKEAFASSTVASGDRHIVDCYAGPDTSSETWVAVGGFTVNAGGEVIVRAATADDVHDGTWGNGYRLTATSAYYGISLTADRVTVDGLSVKNTSTATGNETSALLFSFTLIGQKALNCRAETSCADGRAINANGGGAASQNWRVVNCIGIGGFYGIRVGGTGVVYNSIAIGGTHGLFSANTSNFSVQIKNTYMHGTTCFTDDGGTPTFTTCRHSSAQSISGSTGSTAYSTANFTNVTAGSENFRLPSGSALIDVGTDLSADGTYAFSTDANGVSRGATWDVGPWEFVSGGGGVVGPLLSGHLQGGGILLKGRLV